MKSSTRTEFDSLGSVEVPHDALFGAQTQRAADNFQLSGLRLPPSFIAGLAEIKRAAALSNVALGLLPEARGAAIATAAGAIADGLHHEQFVVDVFQTGSGTSSNMNMNEVVAVLASRACGEAVHANDDVNRCQSSNDVIPAALRVSAVVQLDGDLRPAVSELAGIIEGVAEAHPDLVKTGRTHLMDAMPLRVADELGAWSAQLRDRGRELEQARQEMLELPLGGTAVGTGINAHPGFAEHACRRLAETLGAPFVPSGNRFRDISAQDAPLRLSAALRGLATVLIKISNDLRWMNSGPRSGLGEITLAALQPGSSIMPGKVNPVIPEAVAMVAAQVIGNDATVAVAAQSGNFQLNVMQPVVAYNVLQGIELLANACRHLGGCIEGMTYRAEHLAGGLAENVMLVTALAPKVGYEQAAAIAKRASATGRPLIEIAGEMTSLSRSELEIALDPLRIAKGDLAS